jgi:hypothetical protein
MSAGILSPSPPPPPPTTVTSAQAAIDSMKQRRIDGEAANFAAPGLDEEDEYIREISGTISQTQALISQLGESNPILKRIMNGAVDQMRASAQEAAAAAPTVVEGRRLMVRQFEYPQRLSEDFIDHPIQTQLKEGIPGVDIAVCEALCSAINEDTNITNGKNCQAFAFKRSNPFSLRDQTGRCFLLKSSGSCKSEDFAARLFTRHVESEEICNNPIPGYADEMCVQMATTRTDTRVLTHADATAIAAQTPRDPAPGAGGLPLPRTKLEAGFMVALARQEGVYSFWAASPDSSQGDVILPWGVEGGGNLVYRQNEFRCILVSSATSSTSSKMYASLEACE